MLAKIAIKREWTGTGHGCVPVRIARAVCITTLLCDVPRRENNEREKQGETTERATGATGRDKERVVEGEGRPFQRKQYELSRALAAPR